MPGKRKSKGGRKEAGGGKDVSAMRTNHNERRKDFIKVLAKFLAHDQGFKSVQLEAGVPFAKEWAELRSATPLFGYLTIEEAEKILTEFLS